MHRDESWLREQYLEKGLGVPTIAKMVRRSKKTVRHHMKKFGIPMRSLKESRRLRWERELKAARERGGKQWQDAEWLREQYIERELDANTIAAMVGCTGRAVRDCLKKFEIPTRSLSEAFQVMHKARRKWWQNAEWLERQYIERRFSQVAIAQAVGCHVTTVRHWLRRFGISQRPSRAGYSYPYPKEWTEELRESIRERDGYICALCGKPKGERKLCVHHVDRDKSNCDPANLISLCDPCHGAVHSIIFEIVERITKTKLWHDKGWLRKQYLERGLGTPTMAELAGCSQATLYDALKRFGIPTRTVGDAARLRWRRTS